MRQKTNSKARKKPVRRGPSRTAPKITRILVPTDFSPASDHAAEHAKFLAIRHRAELFLVHVVLPAGSPDLIYGSLLWDQEKVIRSARMALQRWQNDAGLGRLKKVKRQVRVGVPYVEIVEAAREQNCDLVVIPTHGRTGLQHYVLGGTAERVVRHAHCPVLVVRAR